MKPWEHLVQYYETDQMGIVHHSNYIRWMEEARTFFLREVGLSYRAMEEAGILIPVLGVNCTYHSMVRFEDTVEINPKLISYNGVKLELSYEIRDQKTGELRASGESRHCFLTSERRPLSLKRSHPGLHQKFVELLEG